MSAREMFGPWYGKEAIILQSSAEWNYGEKLTIFVYKTSTGKLVFNFPKMKATLGLHTYLSLRLEMRSYLL